MAISRWKRDSDAYLVVDAGHAVSLLNKCTERTVLVGRIDNPPKLDDTIVHGDARIMHQA